MQRPKNLLLLVVLVSVVTVALAAVFYTTRASIPPRRSVPAPATTDRLSSSPAPVVADASPAGTPSAAAQKRAKEFNDATNRFNAPDGQ